MDLTWVGGCIKAHVSSQKILSQKEAELVLAGKRNMGHLTSYCETETLEEWVHLCMYSLICFKSINKNLLS